MLPNKHDGMENSMLLDAKLQEMPSIAREQDPPTVSTEPLLLKDDLREAHSTRLNESPILARPINADVNHIQDEDLFSDVNIDETQSEVAVLRTVATPHQVPATDLRGLHPYVAAKNYDSMPRRIIIARLQTSQPLAEEANSVETFNVCHTVFDQPMYEIRSWKDTSLDRRNSRLCMELVRIETQELLSSWNTPMGFTACACCCEKCASDLRLAGSPPPGYSLWLKSPTGLADGQLRLVDKMLNICGPNNQVIYNIECQPSNIRRHQIRRNDRKPAGHRSGFSMFNHQEIWAQLPSVETESHLVLLVAGLFALHFMQLHRPSHPKIRPQDNCWRDGEKCVRCLLACSECIRSSWILCSGHINCCSK